MLIGRDKTLILRSSQKESTIIQQRLFVELPSPKELKVCEPIQRKVLLIVLYVVLPLNELDALYFTAMNDSGGERERDKIVGQDVTFYWSFLQLHIERFF